MAIAFSALAYLPAQNIVPSLITTLLQFVILVAAITASAITASRALRCAPRSHGWAAWLALGIDAATMITFVAPLTVAIIAILTEGYYG
ncbi:hypothetical protein SAMN05216554_0324 [Herbiconiux ginsengi]|uniref:Uncharacterized protein n=2 Tax=Herbiconiux ginsengi TaxID=381665 RepID=A0A1H3JVB6_9MICO|nr:hypothetical protein SAMN05216554_0324 [Herbiconiux ginsengi]